MRGWEIYFGNVVGKSSYVRSVLWLVIQRGCFSDLARSNGILLVYSPTSLSSFQYITRFHEQLNISKWKSLPVVLFANVPTQRSLTLVHGSREFTPNYDDVMEGLTPDLLSQTAALLPICMVSRSLKHYLVARAQLHFQLCSVSSVNITAHRPPHPTEKASWISSP